MIIGINATAAFKQPRTGVEEYTYQLIKHLAMLKESERHRFLLYASNQQFLDFNLPDNFKIKQLKWGLPMWTQVRLTGELLLRQPDALFIPVHILPLIRPKNSVVTIHGLEYEYYPEMYPPRHLRYLCWSTKYALKHARKIIAVSENTKKDLVELYGGKPEKIEVVHHGINDSGHCEDRLLENSQKSSFCHSRPCFRRGKLVPAKAGSGNPASIRSILNTGFGRSGFPIESGMTMSYILFIGRIETKKNIHGLIQAFNLLKEKYKISHKLVLVGPRGYGYESFKFQVPSSKFENDIIETGYISEQEKQVLLKNADVFVLPSFYEGFGMPILEAQTAGAPVVTSNISSMPEVAGKGAILIDPKNIESIAEGIYNIISDEIFKKDLIQKGRENIKRFSWQKCAEDTLRILSES